jgi:hypothetical protein
MDGGAEQPSRPVAAEQRGKTRLLKITVAGQRLRQPFIRHYDK